MLRILVLSFLAVANSQNVIEIGSNPSKINLVGIGGVRNGFSSLNGPYSSLFSNRVSSFGNNGLGYNVVALRPSALNLGLGSYNGYGSGISYGLGGLSGLSGYSGLTGLGSLAVRPSVNLVAAQPQAYSLVAAQQPQAVSYVAAQPAVNYVSSAQPASVSLLSAQPASVGVVSGHSQQVVPVSAAIHSTRTVEYKPVPYNDEPLVPQIVEVEASELPLNIHFKSRSSTIQLSQSHTPGEPGTVEQTQSQDEPSRVIHEVSKPVVQEVREVIQPYRQVTQEVQPVIEQIHTVVSRGEGVRQQYVAQPQVVQTVQQARPVATFQAIAQPVGAFQVSQPAAAFQAIAQPVSYQAVAQPIAIGQAVRTVAAQPYSVAVAQPASALFQSVRSVQQPSVFAVSHPSLSSYSIQAQPAVAVRTGGATFLSNGVSASRSLGGGSVVAQSASLPANSASFSRTYAENASDEDQK